MKNNLLKSHPNSELSFSFFSKNIYKVLFAMIVASLAWSPSFAANVNKQMRDHNRSHLSVSHIAQDAGKLSPGGVRRRARSEKSSATAMVNINQANAAELASLKGIGQKKAEAVVKYRKQHGDFKNVDDMAAVKGISVNTIERNRSRITV